MDWPAIRLEYVHGTATLAELAERHGIYPATLAARVDKENWSEDRRHHQERSRAVGQDGDVAALLARFNEDDLTVARAIRAKAAQMIQGTTTPAEIAALAKVMDIAHKIGRVALGADPDKR